MALVFLFSTTVNADVGDSDIGFKVRYSVLMTLSLQYAPLKVDVICSRRFL